MTKSQAKEVIELLSKDKTEIAKEDVFKIIDMIDESVTIRTVEYPSYPSYPSNIPKPWWDTVTCGREPNVTLNG